MTSYADRGHPESNGQRGGRAASTPAEHDRRAVRRAVAAGAGAAAVVGGMLAVGLAPGGGAAVAAGLLLGLAIGALVAALWSAASVGLDILADRQPGRRRLVWMGALVAVAFLATGLAFGAGTAL